jgi:acyl carrier protein
MDRQVILQQVKRSIADSCGIPEDRIEPSATLFHELGVSSIDLVEILFTLESAFDVELKISDIETRTRHELQDVPFEVDGVITPAGLDVLRETVPELAPDKLVAGLTMFDIVNLITVEILCSMVSQKLSEQGMTDAPAQR